MLGYSRGILLKIPTSGFPCRFQFYSKYSEEGGMSHLATSRTPSVALTRSLNTLPESGSVHRHLQDYSDHGTRGLWGTRDEQLIFFVLVRICACQLFSALYASSIDVCSLRFQRHSYHENRKTLDARRTFLQCSRLSVSCNGSTRAPPTHHSPGPA